VYWGREGCVKERGEHQGSRLPDLLRECAADPLFYDAAFREFTPEDEAMVREKAGGEKCFRW
jgi:hypothetical protein